MAPTSIEYDRLGATVNAINLRPDDGPEVAVLLTRAVPNAVATTAYRVILEEDGTGF